MSKPNLYTDSTITEPLLKKKEQVIKKAEKILTPTQNRIFSMDREVLLGHFVLIAMKKSRLSAEERRLVRARVNFGMERGNISDEDLYKAKDKLNAFLTS